MLIFLYFYSNPKAWNSNFLKHSFAMKISVTQTRGNHVSIYCFCNPRKGTPALIATVSVGETLLKQTRDKSTIMLLYNIGKFHKSCQALFINLSNYISCLATCDLSFYHLVYAKACKVCREQDLQNKISQCSQSEASRTDKDWTCYRECRCVYEYRNVNPF